MKRLMTFLLASLLLASCSDQQSQQVQPASVNVTVTAPPEIPDDDLIGLDQQAAGQAAGDIIKKGGGPKDLETALNTPGQTINNVDLNKDKNVDYLSVTEAAGASPTSRTWTISDNLSDGPTTLLVLNLDRPAGTQQVTMQVVPNQQIYGQSSPSYQTNLLLDALVLNAIFSRPYYYSPYYGHYGMYPSYYHPYYGCSPSAYRTRTVTTYRTTKYVTAKSPAYDASKFKTSSSAVKNVSATKSDYTKERNTYVNAQKSQRQYQARDDKKSVGSGGFGKPSSSSSSSSSSSKSSSGGGSKSSSSSSRSSSRGRR